MHELGYFVMTLFLGLAWVLTLSLVVGAMIFGGLEIILPMLVFIIPTLIWFGKEL